MSRRALVLGSGGLTGIAWLIGLLTGLADEGLDFADADLVVGTSAGSVVGALLRSGTRVDELYDRQLDESAPGLDVTMSRRARVWSAIAYLRPGDPARARAWIGRKARAARVPSHVDQRAALAMRLGEPEWPPHPLAVTAVDAESGALTIFSGTSGVPLLDAVAASCAIPGVWRPVPIGGRFWIDGGIRSSVNVEVARGHDRVVVLAPIGFGVPREVRRLGTATRTAVVMPDKAARVAMGGDALDAARRPAAARAGRAQTRAAVADVASVWRD